MRVFAIKCRNSWFLFLTFHVFVLIDFSISLIGWRSVIRRWICPPPSYLPSTTSLRRGNLFLNYTVLFVFKCFCLWLIVFFTNSTDFKNSFTLNTSHNLELSLCFKIVFQPPPPGFFSSFIPPVFPSHLLISPSPSSGLKYFRLHSWCTVFPPILWTPHSSTFNEPFILHGRIVFKEFLHLANVRFMHQNLYANFKMKMNSLF